MYTHRLIFEATGFEADEALNDIHHQGLASFAEALDFVPGPLKHKVFGQKDGEFILEDPCNIWVRCVF